MPEEGNGPVPVALKIAYDGRRFDGFARQPQKRLRTVEGELLQALWDSGVVLDPEDCGYRPGSRTDQGVSARGNTVAFESMIPAGRVPGALVGRVPGLWALSGVQVERAFDPRRARWREYRFFVSRRELPAGVGRDALSQALRLFVGQHDFSGFSRREAHRSPIREVLGVDVDGPDDEGFFVLRVRGASFLWQQVRRMIAAALAVCRGEATLDDVRARLEDPSRATSLQVAWGVAPAPRLVLWQVHDPRVKFEVPWTLAQQLQEEWVADRGDAVAASRFLGALVETGTEPISARARRRP